jgi:transglutaminase-like putative cysteine protease
VATDGLRKNLPGAFSRAKRADRLATLVLLFVLMVAAMAGVAGVLTGPNWGLLLQSLFLGLLTGWGLALFRQSAWRGSLIVIAFGFAYIFLFPGGLIEKAIPVLAEIFHLIPEWVASPRGETVDFASLIDLSYVFFSSAGIIMTRLQAWLLAFVEGQPSFDPVAAALVWNAIVWLVAAWAGWVIEARQNTLLAVLPAILLSVSTLAYGRRTSFALYLMLGSLLLLLAVVRQEQREQAWVESDAAFPAKKGRQIIFVSLLVTLALVLFSAFTSSISIRRIQEWISEHTKSSAQQENGNLGKSLGIIPGSTAAPDVFKAARNPGLPQEHLIGSGPELSQRVVMTIAVKDLSSLSQAGQTLPLYWRSYTYDIYTGIGWRVSGIEPKFYDAESPIQADQRQGQVMIQQDVHPVEDLGGTVYTAGEPVTIDLKSEAAWRSFDDLFGLQLEKSSTYRSLSAIPQVDKRKLRAAGQRYPDWLRERYLSLPSSVPDRVRALAIELTASEPTPYDRAKAIERYLRTFPYSLDVPHPPSSREVADYFLFDLQQGYCDYYATSMVVLTRAAGVPSRLAMGYANGTYNLNSKRFVVTEADAHSWVEIYFPNIGWVPFEPTASRPQLEREKPAFIVQPSVSPPPVVSQERTTPRVWGWLFSGIGTAGIVGLLWVLFVEVQLRRMSEQKVAIEVYRRMRRFGKSLDVESPSSDTPYEFTNALINRLQELGFQKPEFASDLFRKLQALTDDIVRTSYRPSPQDSVHASSVLQQWKGLRWKLWWLWVLSYEKKHIGFVSQILGITMEQEKESV